MQAVEPPRPVPQTRVTEVEDRMFGALSARLGVDNVREQMEAHSAQREAALEQKMKLAKQVPL